MKPFEPVSNVREGARSVSHRPKIVFVPAWMGVSMAKAATYKP